MSRDYDCLTGTHQNLSSTYLPCLRSLWEYNIGVVMIRLISLLTRLEKANVELRAIEKGGFDEDVLERFLMLLPPMYNTVVDILGSAIDLELSR